MNERTIIVPKEGDLPSDEFFRLLNQPRLPSVENIPEAELEESLRTGMPVQPKAPTPIYHNETPVTQKEFMRTLGDTEQQLVINIGEAELINSFKLGKAREAIVPSLDTLVPVADVEINALCNTPEEVYLNNVRINSARTDIPWMHVVPEHLEHVVIVGGGPSVEIQLHEIAVRTRLGQTLFALNGAAKYLRDRHFVVDWQVVMDSRPETVRFLKELPAKNYLVSSGCDPGVFDFLVEQKASVMLFHMPHVGLAEVLPKGRNVVMIGGEYTVGLTAISAATALGYRSIHLYGYDSSDSDDGRPHVYAQEQTEAEKKRLHIVCAGRKFSCTFGMFKQAEVFPRFAGMLADYGCTISVHGDGLLPTVAREMVRYDAPENAACYNMVNGPASFDFVTWLVVAEMDRVRRKVPSPLKVAFTAGPDEGFRPNDVQNTLEKQQILDHVMRPALALFGAVEDPEAAGGRQFHYWYRPVTDGFRCGEDVPKCKAPTGDVMEVACWLAEHKLIKPLTITLRETRYSPERNSDVGAWTEFARRRRDEGYHVVFVRDTARADEPIEDFAVYPKAARNLWTRAALFHLASCNLIVANGPAELLQFSDWPFIEFKPPHIDPLRPVSLGISWWQRFAGITPPESFPWLGKHQLTVWQRDTVENIEAAWLRWRAANET